MIKAVYSGLQVKQQQSVAPPLVQVLQLPDQLVQFTDRQRVRQRLRVLDHLLQRVDNVLQLDDQPVGRFVQVSDHFDVFEIRYDIDLFQLLVGHVRDQRVNFLGQDLYIELLYFNSCIKHSCICVIRDGAAIGRRSATHVARVEIGTVGSS